MWRRVVALSLVASLGCAGVSGCSWMGRTTGQAVRGMEEGADQFQQGYSEGVGRPQSQSSDNKPAEAKKK